MATYVWQQAMDPDFPLAVVEYVARGDQDPMHWHDHYEIALVLEGHGSFRFGRRDFTAAAGDIFLVDNSHPHVAVADAGMSLRLLLTLFRPELVAGPGCRELDLGYLAPFHLDERSASPRIPGSAERAAQVALVLHQLRAIWERGDPSERHLTDATLRLALALLRRHRSAPTLDGARFAADRRRQIRPVLAYVDGHRGESITLGDVAEVVHVSPSRVRHVFKDVTGVSFKEYVTQVRIAEAKRLLLGTDLSVAEIACRVSYTNLHQFYKVFYRSCAMSPGEYRRQYTPVGGSVDPATDGVAPAGGGAAPAGGSVDPATDGVAPAGGGAAPAGGSVDPATDAVAPAGGGVAAARGDVAPAGGRAAQAPAR